MYSIYIDNSISMYITVLIYTIHFTSVSCTWHIVTSHRICINEIWLIPLISLILRKRRTGVPAITVFAIASRSWKQMASQFLKMCLGFRNLWEKLDWRSAQLPRFHPVSTEDFAGCCRFHRMALDSQSSPCLNVEYLKSHRIWQAHTHSNMYRLDRDYTYQAIKDVYI